MWVREVACSPLHPPPRSCRESGRGRSPPGVRRISQEQRKPLFVTWDSGFYLSQGRVEPACHACSQPTAEQEFSSSQRLSLTKVTPWLFLLLFDQTEVNLVITMPALQQLNYCCSWAAIDQWSRCQESWLRIKVIMIKVVNWKVIKAIRLIKESLIRLLAVQLLSCHCYCCG